MKNRQLTLPWMWEARQQVDLGSPQIAISDQVFPRALGGKSCFTNSPLIDSWAKRSRAWRASSHSSTASHTHSSRNCRSRDKWPLPSPWLPSATSVLCTLSYLSWRELSGLYLFSCCVACLILRYDASGICPMSHSSP